MMGFGLNNLWKIRAGIGLNPYLNGSDVEDVLIGRLFSPIPSPEAHQRVLERKARSQRVLEAKQVLSPLTEAERASLRGYLRKFQARKRGS